MNAHAETSILHLTYTLVALLLLAGLSFGLRFAQLGGAGIPVALGIAALKATLVAIVFMELLQEKVTVRLAFTAGLCLFALMMALIVADVLTRAAPPLQAPPGMAERYRG